MKRLPILIMIIVAMAQLSAWAAPVDEATAAQCASQFLNRQVAQGHLKAAPAASVMQLVQVEKGVQDMPAYYVFNADDSYVIVAGDDRAESVLGFGDGQFDPETIPCNMQGLLSHYKEQMEWLQTHPDARVKPREANEVVVVSPLLTCTWSQGAPYYNLCPFDKGVRCVTGCVATAMAQVMYYWHYPDVLPDLPAYTTGFYHIYLPALPATPVDWAEMCDGYTMPYTPAQGMAVATLMRYCGQASSMEYGTDGSGSGTWNQYSAMMLLGYNQAMRFLHRDDYETQDWLAMMHEDLTQGRPILYCGSGEGGGHAYVVDGCIGWLFHINWGWEGNYNDYFVLDAFDVAGTSFSYGQSMLYRLYPAEDVPLWDIDVDGVCYKLNGHEATVTTRERRYGSYSGAVVIPSEVTSQGVTYPVTAIADGAFKNCSSLRTVTLPPTIKRIGKYAFKDCTSLRAINIPDGVTEIADFAFLNCWLMSTLTMGRHVEEIGYYAFYGCSMLSQLSLPSSMKRIDEGAFMNCTTMKRLTTGNGVEEIGDKAFANCRMLSEVVIGNNLRVIGRELFSNCQSLQDVTVGLSVDSIGPNAFVGCRSLSRLKMYPELPPVVDSEESFPSTCYSSTTLIVPDISFDDYYCADIWTLFDNIISLDDVAVNGDVNGDGEVNIADVNAVIDTILSGMGGDESFDVNGDGEVNIADVNAVVDIILGS